MSQLNKQNSVINAAANVKIYHARLEDIARFTSDKLNHLRRGGIRQGTGRTTTEVKQLLEKIPPSQRSGLDRESAAYQAKKYLSDKDASHVKSHHNGGSNHPDNIQWENSSLNRSRGSRNMTRQEQRNLAIQAKFKNLTGAIKAGVKATPKGAAIGAITTVPFSTLRNGLRVVRGEISSKEAALEIAKETGIGAGIGGATAFTVTTVATACPPIAIALSAISPALLVAGGAGLAYEFFKILEEHKQEVRAYYESMTEQELQYLSQIEAELIYEHEKTLVRLKEQQQLTKIIVNRSRGSGVQGAIEKYLESKQIYQSLQDKSKSIQSRLLSNSQQKLPPLDT